MQPRHGAWPVDSLTHYQRGGPAAKYFRRSTLAQEVYQVDSASERIKLEPVQGRRETDRTITGFGPGAG